MFVFIIDGNRVNVYTHFNNRRERPSERIGKERGFQELSFENARSFIITFVEATNSRAVSCGGEHK